MRFKFRLIKEFIYPLSPHLGHGFGMLDFWKSYKLTKCTQQYVYISQHESKLIKSVGMLLTLSTKDSPGYTQRNKFHIQTPKNDDAYY